MKKIILFFIFLSTVNVFARVKIEESYFINDPQKTILKTISMQKDLAIDHVTPFGFEVYGPKGLGAWLKGSKVSHFALGEISIEDQKGYPTPEQIESELKSIASAYPETCKLFSIGKSYEGRELWVMKISNQAQLEDNRPEFKYIANMHGDEIVGRELMVRLIKDLLSNYGKDQQITNLMDKIAIYIMPSMNPDGAARSTRYNSQGYDLNRDFPDFSTNDNQNDVKDRAPETQAVMKWQATRRFTLSANFHGGAEVVNYPYDTIPDKFPLYDLVVSLSLDYATKAKYIGASQVFKNGITNGYDWYEVDGGMQDWSYHWYNDLQLTIELSNSKWPSYSTVDKYYRDNREALLSYIGHTL